MPVENLNFLGINRAISDFSPSSACEEIINLRQSTNGLVPVKPFSRIMTNVEYDKVFVHKTSTVTNYIGVKKGQSTVSIDLIGETGHLYQIPAYTHLTIDKIHFAYAGNVILFSVADPEDHFYQNIAFIWKDTGYVETSAGIPEFTPTITPTYNPAGAEIAISEDMSKSELVERIINGFNQIQEENKNTCFGPIIIAFAFKTTSGQTFWTGKWYVYDPTHLVRSQTDTFYVDSANDLPEEFQADFASFFTKHTDGGYVVYTGQSIGSDPGAGAIALGGAKITITIPSIGTWNDSTSILSSIEIYASRPQLYVDTDVISDNIKFEDMSAPTLPQKMGLCLLPQKPYRDMELDSQLLYHQKSIPLKDFASGTQSVDLYFGGNEQVTDDTLDVDSGMVTRYGEVMSYNARFHFFNSVSKIDIGVPDFSAHKSGLQRMTGYFFATYQDESMQTGETRYVGSKSSLIYDNPADIVIAPTLYVKEVIVFFPTNLQAATGYLYRYRMTPSTAYNYSICTEGSYSSSGDKSYYANLISAGVKRVIENEEQDTINVTEQYSPFVFNVDHSYLAPGKVIDIQPQMSFTREDPYGVYPLNVFTSRGVYALMQGSSNVLYGAFYPMAGLVSVSNSVPTQLGTFFLAAGALWLISGSHTVLISDALSLGPHTYIRNNDGFKKISLGYGALPGSYSVATILSTVPFKDYIYKESIVSEQTVISKATLSYNPYNEELYVSNKDYNYTYALSTKHRQWFKLSGKIWQDVPGSNIANRPGASPYLLNVVDFSGVDDETQMVVHIQSRPFSFAMQYAHIHRIVAMIRAELGFFSSLSYHSADTLVVALYGSDNLQDWSLLNYAQRAGTSTSEEIEEETVVTETPLKISQIRTPSASRSWRYYTICIGGKVHYDTDFGQVLIDYQPVARRLG